MYKSGLKGFRLKNMNANWKDMYWRYEAGVWAVPLALLPSFLFSALAGQPSCLEPIIEVIIAHTPLTLANWILAILGPFARPLALIGAVAFCMPLLGLASIFAPPIADLRPRRRGWYLRWFMVLLIVLTASGYLATSATSTVNALSTVLAGVVCVPALLWTRSWRRAMRSKKDVSGRRRVLYGLFGAPIVTGCLALLASYEAESNLAARLLGLENPVRRLFVFNRPHPRKPGFPVSGIEPEVTPVHLFYVNGKNITNPLLLAQDWELRISGLVHTPLTLTFQQLLAMPRISYFATMRCVDDSTAGHLMSTAYWSGVRITDLLTLVKPLAQATTLLFRGADQFTETLALHEPSLSLALLAYAMNGETLLQQHGAPARVVLPGWYGFRNVKWVYELVLTAEPVVGYWEHNGWQAQQVGLVARIDVVHPLDTTHVLVAGVAFGGLRGVSKVQVRVDNDEWQDAILNVPALSPYTWVQWRSHIAIIQRRCSLTARMIDGAGVPQDAHTRGSFPAGASGLQRISILYKGE